MTNKPSDIAFTSDIVESIAKDLGVSKDYIEEHIDFIVHWIKKLTRDPKVLSIYIPNIGRMFFNFGRAYDDYVFFKKNEGDLSNRRKEALDLMEKRMVYFEEEFKDFQGYNRHKKRSKLTNKHFNKGKNMRELEEWQNAQ